MGFTYLGAGRSVLAVPRGHVFNDANCGSVQPAIGADASALFDPAPIKARWAKFRRRAA